MPPGRLITEREDGDGLLSQRTPERAERHRQAWPALGGAL